MHDGSEIAQEGGDIIFEMTGILARRYVEKQNKTVGAFPGQLACVTQMSIF